MKPGELINVVKMKPTYAHSMLPAGKVVVLKNISKTTDEEVAEPIWCEEVDDAIAAYSEAGISPGDWRYAIPRKVDSDFPDHRDFDVIMAEGKVLHFCLHISEFTEGYVEICEADIYDQHGWLKGANKDGEVEGTAI